MHADHSHARNGLSRSLRHPNFDAVGACVLAQTQESRLSHLSLRFHYVNTFLVHFQRVFISFQALHATVEPRARTVFRREQPAQICQLSDFEGASRGLMSRVASSLPHMASQSFAFLELRGGMINVIARFSAF